MSLRNFIKRVLIKPFQDNPRSKIQTKTYNKWYLNKLVFLETDRKRKQYFNPRAWALTYTGLCGALRAMRILALEFLSKNDKRSRTRRGAKPCIGQGLFKQLKGTSSPFVPKTWVRRVWILLDRLDRFSKHYNKYYNKIYTSSENSSIL